VRDEHVTESGCDLDLAGISKLRERIRGIADSAKAHVRAHGLVCVATDTKFVAVSPAWTDLLGWPSTLLENGTFANLIHPGDRGRTEEALTQLKTKPLRGFTNRYRTISGDYVRLAWDAEPFDGEGQTFAVARRTDGD